MCGSSIKRAPGDTRTPSVRKLAARAQDVNAPAVPAST